jgi:hypothetical protein
MSVAMENALLAEYATPEALLAALRRLRELGYRRLDAFTPYPVRGAEDLLDLPRSPVPRWVLGFGLLGAGGAYFLQWWMNAYNYPIDVGGRPPHSAPAFVPITFEMGVLFAGLTAFIAVFVLGRLAAPHHPVFAVEGFERASIDRFWVGVDASDPRFDRVRTRDDLDATAPIRVAWAGGES